jgi:hypothetical protein
MDFLKAVYAALKPGGVLGVIDHLGIAGPGLFSAGRTDQFLIRAQAGSNHGVGSFVREPQAMRGFVTERGGRAVLQSSGPVWQVNIADEGSGRGVLAQHGERHGRPVGPLTEASRGGR